MKPGKEFDCVEMKAEIQERLLREVAELGEEEAQRRRAERLVRDPILSRFLRMKLADVPGSAEGVLMPLKGSTTGGS
jgi:hypothetical protein